MSKAMKLFRTALAASVLGASALLATAQNDGSQQNKNGRAGNFAIVGARIVTVSGSVIENGTVVIQNGKITAVSQGTSVPAGTERIDGRGLSVYPGMIDASTNMGLSEIAQGANATMDVQELGNNNANAKAITAVHPYSAHVNVTRVNGITTVVSQPQGGLISGQSTIINLNGSTQAEMAVVPTYGLVLNFPRVTGGGGFGGGFGGFGGGGGQDFNELVRRRDAAIDDLKKLFREVERYAKTVEAYEKDKSAPTPTTDLRMAAMIPYVRGQKPIQFIAERERDIRAIARFVGEMKVKGVIVGGQDAWKVADDLKKNNIAVIYTNIYSLPVQQDDAYDYLFAAPSMMQKAGVKFAISTGNPGEETRDLPYHAGLAGAYGLSKEEALKSVTLYPAQILGIDNMLGSIEVGKMANVVVTDGDLLDPRTNVKHVFIAGRLIPLTSRHTELFDSFKDRK
jgi:imidazolonepropionase-like amidohydrolase